MGSKSKQVLVHVLYLCYIVVTAGWWGSKEHKRVALIIRCLVLGPWLQAQLSKAVAPCN